MSMAGVRSPFFTLLVVPRSTLTESFRDSATNLIKTNITSIIYTSIDFLIWLFCVNLHPKKCLKCNCQPIPIVQYSIILFFYKHWRKIIILLWWHLKIFFKFFLFLKINLILCKEWYDAWDVQSLSKYYGSVNNIN